MSINKKNSRKITVNQTEFIWKIKYDKNWCPCCSTGTFNIMVEKINAKKPLLIKVHNSFPENSSVTPNVIKNLIIFGLKKGWIPDSTSIFTLDLDLEFKDFDELFLKTRTTKENILK